MEQEVLQELDKEEHLSQLFSRKVTLEGLHMFSSVIRPAAEEDVQTFLPLLHSKLLRICQRSTGDAKPAELLEQSTAALVPEVVDTALKFLLEEPERENKIKAASAEIAKLLMHSAASCLSQFGPVSKDLLRRPCHIGARCMVKAIYKRFDEHSKSFHLMDYDESYYSATEGVISAVQDMDHEVQTDTSSQAVCLDEEIDSLPDDATKDASTQDETLVQDSSDHEVQTDTSSQAHLQLEEGPLEERGTSPEVTSLEELETRLVEKRGASPQVSVDEEIDTLPDDVTKDASSQAETLVQDCAKKKKKGVKAFFCCFWKKMTCCCRVSTKD